MNRQTRRKDNKNERGSALVLTLGILSLVLIMGMSFAFSSRTSRQVAKVNADQVKANLHGESGLDYALGVMQIGFVEKASGGGKIPVLYPAGHRTPDEANEFEKRCFEFKKHNLAFKVNDKWSHQHIWSYVPKNNNADNSTDDEIPNEGDTKDEKKDDFDTNKYKHSFYYTLMNEVPQLRLQALKFVEKNDNDTNLPDGEEQGTKDNVQDYLKEIGFHTIKSDDEIVGRVGFLVLEEGHKFDVNQMLTLKIPASGDGNIPFVVHNKTERRAGLEDVWNTDDYYYNITGKYNPKYDLEDEDDDTIRWGLHIQELKANNSLLDDSDSDYYTTLLNGATIDGVSTKVRWMSYDHLWKGMNSSSSDLPDNVDNIYSNSSSFFKDHTRFTFFSAEEPEAWWYDTEGLEISRFDVTGYEWRENDCAYYIEESSKMKPATTVTVGENQKSANGWEDISNDNNKAKALQTLAFVKDNNGTKEDDDKLPTFLKEKDDDGEESGEGDDDDNVSYCIPALADMKDENGQSVALQVAANMVDYCDGNDYATVLPQDASSKLAENNLANDFTVICCGNEKVGYFNELGLTFYAQRLHKTTQAGAAIIGDNNEPCYTYALYVKPQIELANMFGIWNNDSIELDNSTKKGDIFLRIIGNIDITCDKNGEHGIGEGPFHTNTNDPNKTFDIIIKGEASDNWSENGYITIEFAGESEGNGRYKVFKYDEYAEAVQNNPPGNDGQPATYIYKVPEVNFKVNITRVAMVSGKKKENGEIENEKIYDFAWWKSKDDNKDAFSMEYIFGRKEVTVLAPDDIDLFYGGSLEANDPRCNHRSIAWKWKKMDADGHTYKKIDSDDFWYEENEEKKKMFDHSLGMNNSIFKPSNEDEYYQTYDEDEEKIVDVKKMDVEDYDEVDEDDEYCQGKIYGISTSFIKNRPFETLWELGAIHRGEPFRTINLSYFSDNFEDEGFSGKYRYGDAQILDQVKIGPAEYSRGKFNVNSRSTASYVLFYDKKCFGINDSYDNPNKNGSDLPEPKWALKDVYPHYSRGQIANLIDNLDDYENDRQMESIIGRTANLLSTRNEAYTIIVISQALQERKDLSDAMTAASMSDAQKKELIKTNMTNPTWYKVYEDAGTSKEHLCEILGTNVIMAHVVRDGWTGKIKVVKKEYLNNK